MAFSANSFRTRTLSLLISKDTDHSLRHPPSFFFLYFFSICTFSLHNRHASRTFALVVDAFRAFGLSDRRILRGKGGNRSPSLSKILPLHAVPPLSRGKTKSIDHERDSSVNTSAYTSPFYYRYESPLELHDDQALFHIFFPFSRPTSFLFLLFLLFNNFLSFFRFSLLFLFFSFFLLSIGRRGKKGGQCVTRGKLIVTSRKQ